MLLAQTALQAVKTCERRQGATAVLSLATLGRCVAAPPATFPHVFVGSCQLSAAIVFFSFLSLRLLCFSGKLWSSWEIPDYLFLSRDTSLTLLSHSWVCYINLFPQLPEWSHFIFRTWAKNVYPSFVVSFHGRGLHIRQLLWCCHWPDHNTPQHTGDAAAVWGGSWWCVTILGAQYGMDAPAQRDQFIVDIAYRHAQHYSLSVCNLGFMVQKHYGCASSYWRTRFYSKQRKFD